MLQNMFGIENHTEKYVWTTNHTEIIISALNITVKKCLHWKPCWKYVCTENHTENNMVALRSTLENMFALKSTLKKYKKKASLKIHWNTKYQLVLSMPHCWIFPWGPAT